MQNQETWAEQIGALHVHTRYSDGTGTVGNIVGGARAAGLDFIVLSDHDTLAARREGWHGLHDGVAVLVAVEITPRRGPHVLAMDVAECVGYAARTSRGILDGIAEQGGYAVIAHPMGKRKPTLGINHAPWEYWQHGIIRGMEIWSYMYDWVDEVVWWRLPYAYEFWKHPERCVRGPRPKLLRHWDRMGRDRRIAGLAGLDCHARRLPVAGAHIFPYEQMFRCLRNHLFIPAEDTGAARVDALWQALAEGRGFVSHDIVADATGTRCFATLPDGRMLQMGQEAQFQDGAELALALPRKAEIRWIADGRCRLVESSRQMNVRPAGPGVYRFEAHIDDKPWLYTNPFYLR